MLTVKQIKSREYYLKKKQAGLCNRCGKPAALKVIFQDGEKMDEKRLTICWKHR